MTCRERLKLEHPEKINDKLLGGCEGCPHDYGYLDKPKVCGGPCDKCWDREIPEEKIRTAVYANDDIYAIADVDAAAEKKIDAIAKKVYDTCGIPAQIIKDSGDRTVFDSGAVRDMHEGKGRCDLMPLYVVSTDLDDSMICYISLFQEIGDIAYLYRVLDECDIFPDKYTMYLEVAIHFEEGCKKYGENNWRKGIPLKFYIDSAVRHYLKYKRGDTDERHDRAFIWNILCCIWTHWKNGTDEAEKSEGDSE